MTAEPSLSERGHVSLTALNSVTEFKGRGPLLCSELHLHKGRGLFALIP